MDISVNGGRPNPSPNQNPTQVKTAKSRRRPLKSLSVMSLVLLVSIAILVLSTSALLAFGKKDSKEGRYVDETKLQAVFLNGGQVYFGNIQNLNREYIRMGNIYYLRVNQQVQPGNNAKQSDQDISLVKLGCELHGPENQMVINREQVIFWENLKNDGQVAKAVKQYQEQNPDGQKCETETTNTNTSNDKANN
ncbi:hypothetical protein KA047_00435 [Candidatus Saccharibacteria bacterium]|nr:hypothetical protein [Candidatus Saccharibacteria bacterium]